MLELSMVKAVSKGVGVRVGTVATLLAVRRARCWGLVAATVPRPDAR
jgi:hypothetical protein